MKYRVYPPNNSSPPSPDNATVTCRRASWATRCVGICEESAKGSSYIDGSFGITLTTSSGVRCSSV
jgi:hypothetical protein